MSSAIAELQMPPLHRSGDPIVCPVCGQDDDLTLVIDSEDFSEAPSVMHCDDQHTWSEPRVPRFIGASLFAQREREAPETIDWSGAATVA